MGGGLPAGGGGLGVAMERRNGYGEVYVHPSALTPDWGLKQGAPLQSPWAVNERSLANLFTGVLMNCRVFLKSWAEYLLSAAHFCTPRNQLLY